MYIDGFFVVIAAMVFMVLGAVANEFARYLVKKLTKDTKYEFHERLGHE